ncbi:hypothetical protein KC909_06455, partial [Candidatus Dojkabacteria bacterium]|nr:hypothetical protein [Candidatus Dojkabacteria bacterium]
HNIGSLLSTVPDIKLVSEKLLQEFKDVTFKGMVEYVYNDELKVICEQITEFAMKYFAKRVYEYLDSNLSVQAAKENVIDYHKRLVNPPAIKFPEQLKVIEQEIESILKKNYEKMKYLNEDTKKVLLQEFKELTLLYISEGDFIPYNYYILDFRSPEEFTTDEESYNYIIDTYLYYEQGGYSQIPMESYDLDFSADAKTKIFEAVTNSIENPYYTLNDYLNE